MKRIALVVFTFVAALSPLWAEVRFGDLDLSSGNLLLFTVRADSPGCGSYDSLFLADLQKGSLAQLTYFPERLLYLSGQKVLQIQNRYGVFQSAADLRGFRPAPGFPSFLTDNRVLQGKLSPFKPSPNGRYLLHVVSTSPAFGDLHLVDLEMGSDQLVAKGVEIDLDSPPAVWAPDSSFFVYAKDGVLYYLSVRQAADQRLLSESYRQIGPGRIGNLSRGRGSSLFYLIDSLIYELDSRELFTRALYRGYLDIGRLVGKVPFRFDANFDSFWISPEGAHVLLNKGGRNLFLYVLSSEDFASQGQGQSLPYLYLPRNNRVAGVVWSSGGVLTLLTKGSVNGKPSSAVYRLHTALMSADPVFKKLDLDGVQAVLLSPDESTAVVVLNDRVRLYDYATWKRKSEHPHPQPLGVVWISDGELVIAGRSITELLEVAGGKSRLLAVSQADRYSFSADESAVLASVGQRVYRLSLTAEGTPAPEGWQESSASRLRDRRVVSGSYRAYLEDTPDRLYKNMVMIRDTRNLVTRTLLTRQPPALEPFPDRDEPFDFVTFDHGSRIRRREISLVFNVIDSVEGLPRILSTLSEYGLRCTFFVNGEAIRRYPDAVREIAESGHEVGSLFSTYFNMTDARFRLDREFIKKGLAQNEDDYFEATGRELSLLWHAPYYFVNSDIVEVSREMNYVYVGRDVDPLDWVTREMSLATQNIYFPSSRLLERVVAQKKPGSIVPILAGTADDGRDDYFFQKLDLLVDALVKRGYAVVPVTTLIEHAE